LNPHRRDLLSKPMATLRLFWIASATALVFGGTANGRAASGTEGPSCHGRPATIAGTPGRDVFRFDDGLSAGDVVALGGGRDVVADPETGEGPRLIVCGGPGKDHLEAGSDTGRAVFEGGSGNDSLGSPGDEGDKTDFRLVLFGGSGDDHLYGGNSVDSIRAEGGDDRAFGWWGDDVIRGGAGSDRLEGQGNADRLYGAKGDDFLNGDDLSGDPTEPEFQTGGRDTANGGPGRDRCEAEIRRRCET
jgi:Ca2+-binding RTX toxin-like protein